MKPLTYILLAAVAFAATACNTIAGVGQDIQAGGRVIQRSAQ